MGLTTAMYTGLTGLNVNQERIGTIGNNIANVNTTAFKASRTLFQTAFYQTFNNGTPPSATSGGVNPTQSGLGAAVATTHQIFTNGSVETTGVGTDVAVQGDGFFVTRTAGGRQLYTRDGSFSLNSNNQLVTADGNFVQGFLADANFAINPTVMSDITIPLGSLSIARATSNVVLDGDLSAAGTIATQGSRIQTQMLVNGAGAAATDATALTDLRSLTNPTVPLFTDGGQITVSGVTKGDRTLPAATFTVGQDGVTLGDFASWLNDTLGIQTTAGLPGQPGAVIENGQLVVYGNAGEANDLVIEGSDFLSDNATTPLPLAFTKTQTADGSGVFTSFTVYDSLGTPATVNVTFALDSTPNTGPVWRYYVESPDATGTPRALGTGTINFDTAGNFVSATGNEITLDRSDTGSATPISFTLDFSDVHGLSTRTSSVILNDQDGYPPGTLAGVTIGKDGTINGTFTNGLAQPIGQLALGLFTNPEGLIALDGNNYAEGANSGVARIVQPGQFGAGTLLSGALELSNVDLSREFIGLVTSSTGYQAASRVISVSSDLLDQLLLIIR